MTDEIETWTDPISNKFSGLDGAPGLRGLIWTVRLALCPIRSGHVLLSGVGEMLFLEVSIWLNPHVYSH